MRLPPTHRCSPCAARPTQTYVKRPDTPDLRPYEDRLLAIRAALAGVAYPHAWPAQRVYQSDRAVHLVRQYLFANLGHRVSTRPFLTVAEKASGVGGGGGGHANHTKPHARTHAGCLQPA